MPELPEVETVRRELVPWLTGRTVRRARRADAPSGPKYADLERADGQRILAVNRRGKFLILPLCKGDELIVHLGMTGIISPKKPSSHVRVRVTLSGDGDTTLYFQDVRRFGRFLVVRAGAYETLPTLHRLGPEPLEEGFTDRQFYAALQKSRMAIKAYIMGQRPVAGVGNIYTDESLWRAKIHPLSPANTISRAKTKALRQDIIEVLSASIIAQGTTLNDYRTVNGEVGAYLEELNAYGHAGRPCKRCQTEMKRIVVGQRGTTFCPKCQKRTRM